MIRSEPKPLAPEDLNMILRTQSDQSAAHLAQPEYDLPDGGVFGANGYGFVEPRGVTARSCDYFLGGREFGVNPLV